MGWKTVKGVEYLVRYYSEDGKKKFTSCGRRSEETEAKLKHFEETTGGARRIVKDQRGDVALACRLAKAHELARLPGRQAETLESFWYTGVTDRLSLFGGAALLAYEGKAGALAPADLVKEDRLLFIARTTASGDPVTSSRSHARSVRALARKRQINSEAPQRATASRLVSTILPRRRHTNQLPTPPHRLATRAQKGDGD
jgi:hypothetical protein